jgi:hypothetical protein
VRIEPERVDRVERELLPERVDGVRPEPVREDPVSTLVVAVVGAVATGAALAIPQALQ